MNKTTIPQEYWLAIQENNAAYDGQFYYGVTTTKIVCRPSCRSRVPKRENLAIYQELQTAIKEGYRPCKRCKPNDSKAPDSAWIEAISSYIEQHLHEQLTLDQLGQLFNGSPYHLQRTFKKVMGISPQFYIRMLRMERAKALLLQTDHSIALIGRAVGIPNQPYFTTLFQKETGQSPTAFRKKGTE